MPDKKTLQYYVAELRRIEQSRQADTEKEVKKIYKELLKALNSFLGNEYASYSDNKGVLSVAVLQEKARYAKFLQEADERIQALKRLCKSFSIFAQAERNDRKGIVPDKLQLEFAQRYVYGRCYYNETWSEYRMRHNL